MSKLAQTSEGVTPKNDPNMAQRVSSTQNNRRTTPRNSNRQVPNTSRDFEGATPSIGGILALRSENIVKKVNYDSFCDKLGVYIMREFKNGENVVEVTKNPSEDVVNIFEAVYRPTELSDEDKKSSVNTEIKKEEIKEYVKDLKTMKSNLKKIYNLVYGNSTDSVQTMLKAEDDFETKSKVFDYEWILLKVKMIVSGLDTKVNLRVSLHTAILNYMLLKQFQYESNDAYLTRFKSMVQTLKIAGGEHNLVSTKIMGKALKDATVAEVNEEKEQFMAACYILRSDENRFKGLLEDLKRSANLGRDE